MDREEKLSTSLGKGQTLGQSDHYKTMVANGKATQVAAIYLRRAVTIAGWTPTVEAMQLLLKEAEELEGSDG